MTAKQVSPWAVMDEYDPVLHGQPEQTTPPANKLLAFITTAAVVLAVLAGGYGLWFAAGALAAMVGL
jgi:hypothetical protein